MHRPEKFSLIDILMLMTNKIIKTKSQDGKLFALTTLLPCYSYSDWLPRLFSIKG